MNFVAQANAFQIELLSHYVFKDRQCLINTVLPDKITKNI